MKTTRTFLQFITIILFLLSRSDLRAQQSLKSVLINHGSPSCSSTSGEQQLFTGILSGAPSILLSCSNGVPFYNAFTAYNPKDKKVYFADISSGNSTKMYAMDYHFDSLLACQPALLPDYTYSYQINQLCFDQDGNNLIIYDYNASTGQAAVKRIDVATGTDIAGTSRPLTFPPGLAPNSLSWGDMVFMPNGRVFMTFGNTPSRLYEMINFDGPGDAVAVYLTDIPHPCFSIGYVDGSLFVAGSDGSGCYYYTWDINTASLSNSAPFPMGRSTADITHMNVGAGASEELIGGNVINANTADIIYHVVIKNKGNIDLANVRVSNNLGNTYGNGNLSAVQASFVSNPAGLILNPLYNGVTDTLLLLPGQSISNYPVATDSAVIRLQLRATNLVQNTVYYNSTLVGGEVGAGTTLLRVIDSSNNGTADKIDVNENGVSDDAGEGVPTPFRYNILLAVGGSHFTATLQASTTLLSWKPQQESSLKNYEVARSADGVNFTVLAVVNASHHGQAAYTMQDDLSGLKNSTLYYRIKMVADDGSFSYTPTLLVRQNTPAEQLIVFPNPFLNQVTVTAGSAVRGQAVLTLFDGTGKAVLQQQARLEQGRNTISLPDLQRLARGIYYLEMVNGGRKTQVKLVK